MEKICKLLMTEGYRDWIVVDVTGESAEPKDSIENAYRYLIKKSGLFPIY